MRYLGKNIKILREMKRITQTDLAAAVGVAPAYLSQIETLIRMPSLKVTQRIAKALGTTVETLVGVEPEGTTMERLTPEQRIGLLRKLVHQMELEVEEREGRQMRGD